MYPMSLRISARLWFVISRHQLEKKSSQSQITIANMSGKPPMINNAKPAHLAEVVGPFLTICKPIPIIGRQKTAIDTTIRKNVT